MAIILSLPIHSSAFLLCCLTSMQNSSDFLVPLYCSLNLLLSGKPPSLLYTFCSAWVMASKSCRPSCLARFYNRHSFCLAYTIVLKNILYLYLKFLSSTYLSVELHSNVGSLWWIHLVWILHSMPFDYSLCWPQWWCTLADYICDAYWLHYCRFGVPVSGCPILFMYT